MYTPFYRTPHLFHTEGGKYRKWGIHILALLIDLQIPVIKQEIYV